MHCLKHKCVVQCSKEQCRALVVYIAVQCVAVQDSGQQLSVLYVVVQCSAVQSSIVYYTCSAVQLSVEQSSSLPYVARADISFFMKIEGNVVFADIFSNQAKICIHENLLWSFRKKTSYIIFFTKKGRKILSHFLQSLLHSF